MATTIKVYKSGGIPTLIPDPASNLLPTEINYPVIGTFWDGNYVQFRTEIDRGFTFGGKKFLWSDVRDENGDPAGASLQDVKDYLATIFFLNNSGSFSTQFDLTKVFDTANNFFEQFSLSTSGQVFTHPSANNRPFSGIFFKDTITSIQFETDLNCSTWTILGGTKNQFSAVALKKSGLYYCAEFFQTPSFSVSTYQVTPLVNYDVITTKFFLKYDAGLYYMYGYVSGSWQLLYTAFNNSSAGFSNLTAFETDHKLGIVPTNATSPNDVGVVMYNIFLNGDTPDSGTPLFDFLNA